MVENPSNQELFTASSSDTESQLSEFDSANNEPNRLVLLLMVLAGFTLVGLSIWLYQQEWVQNLQWATWVGLISGLVLFLLSIHRMETTSSSSRLNHSLETLKVWLDLKSWQVFCLFISPVFGLIAWLAAGTGKQMNSPVVAIFIWVLAVGCVTLSGWKFKENRKPIPLRLAFITASLFLLAFLIRGVYINNIPIVLTGDEGSAGLSALEFVNGDANNIFQVGWFSFPSLYFFIQSIPISMLGQTILALRILSVIAGSLTVVAVYLLGRSMFGERAGLFSAIFLAAFHFHNHFSRIGLNNIWDSLWFIVVLGLLWSGVHYENRRFLILSGLALGFSQYFYVSARLLFLLIPSWLVVVGLINPHQIRQHLGSILLMGAAALVTVMPLALYYLGSPDEFLAPMRRASILGSWMVNETAITGQSQFQILLNQFWTSMLAYAHQPLRAWYTPGVPLLRPLPAALFFFGLVLLLSKLRDNRTTLLGMWLIFLTIMVGLSESTPAAQRYVAVSPAVALLVGYGLAESARHLIKLWPQGMRLVNLLAIGIIIFIGIDDVRYYVFDYTPRSNFGGENTLVAHQLADYLKTQPDDLEVLFFGGSRMGYNSIPSLRFLAPHIEGIDINHPWSSPDNPLPSGNNLLFVLLPERFTELESIQNSYPGGFLTAEIKADGKTLYWLYKYSSKALPLGETYLPSTTNIHMLNGVKISSKGGYY